jgi:hypothetical protein
MCMIDNCDGIYVAIGLPDGADLTRCTDCGRTFQPDEQPAEANGYISDEDLPHLYGWIVNVPDRAADEQRIAARPEVGWYHASYWDASIGNDDMDDVEIEWRVDPGGVLSPEVVTYRDWQQEFDYYLEDIPPSVVAHCKRPNVHVACAQCVEARRWIAEVCSGWVYDYVCDEIVEHWHEDTLYRTLGLGAMTNAIRRGKWTDRRGNLIPDVTVRKWVDQAFDEMARREANLVPT